MNITKITEDSCNNFDAAHRTKSSLSVDTQPPTEIVIGIVCSVGTNIDNITSKIKERLKRFNFDYKEIKISSDIITEIFGTKDYADDYERIDDLMTKGNQLRESSGCNHILALGAVTKINQLRDEISIKGRGIAYVINSIKHPGEVEELRKVYGSGFLLFGVYSSKIRRLENLNTNKGISIEDANKLIERDEDEDSGHGQHTRDTFHLADFFLNQDGQDDKINNNMKRIFDLLFGNPFVTPTFDEFSMYMAFSSALRSADLSRQVGAVLAKDDNIISTGANDVPKFGGGLYWPVYNEEKQRFEDYPMGRDYTRGYDANARQKKDIIDNILKDIPNNSKAKIRKILESSGIQDITEYGRVVHAEMEAILTCSRTNTSTYGATIYCTTFPCHNCAKHIIAAGIKRVVYIEPYPKSKAFEFHSESISNDKKEEGKVSFEPFIGIGPRIFFNLFSLVNGNGNKIKRKKNDGDAVDWVEKKSLLRTPLLPVSYLEREQISVNLFGKILGVKDD